jgi:glutamine synthetase
MPAATAADNILLARQIIMEMATLSGRSVTFMPKPFSDQNGSGLHLHQSIWSDDGERNLFATEREGEISHLAKSYVGGLLEHAPYYVAFLAPIVNSYKRLIPGFEAPTKIAWGYRNRSTMIRVPHFNGSEGAARVELRCPDPAISPHLGIAAILAAGIDGIRRNIEPGGPISSNLYHTASDVESLPGSLGDALQRLTESEMLTEALGKSAIDAFLSLRMSEWKDYVKTIGSSDSQDITIWEYEKYLHVN